MKMQTTLHQTINTSYSGVAKHDNLWTRFMNYCQSQEEERLTWLGIILAVHGCMLTPITVMLTLLAGPNFFMFMAAMTCMGVALVTNLAAMPTKITIPAFALTVLADIAIIVSCVFLV